MGRSSSSCSPTSFSYWSSWCEKQARALPCCSLCSVPSPLQPCSGALTSPCVPSLLSWANWDGDLKARGPGSLVCQDFSQTHLLTPWFPFAPQMTLRRAWHSRVVCPSGKAWEFCHCGKMFFPFPILLWSNPEADCQACVKWLLERCHSDWVLLPPFLHSSMSAQRSAKNEAVLLLGRTGSVPLWENSFLLPIRWLFGWAVGGVPLRL